jgi:ribosome recycling factor
MENKIYQETEEKMLKALKTLDQEFNTLRTGRASLAILDGIMVNAYDTPTPIKQVATMSTPDARLIVIQPWDKSLIGAIEKAILAANIGLTPINDGRVIRMNIPQLTEERRKELVKVAKHMAEEARVAVRNVRRHINDAIKEHEKKHEFSEDDRERMLKKVQEITDKYIKKVDETLKIKEDEIMEV